MGILSQDYPMTLYRRSLIFTIPTSIIFYLPYQQNLIEYNRIGRIWQKICSDTLHTPTCFYYSNLHYILPTLLAKFSRIWQKTRSNSMHTPTRLYYLNLYYIRPALLAELNKIQQEARSNTVVCPMHNIAFIKPIII